jgi:hypothetical protein
MDVLSFAREQMQWAHELLEMVMADVTEEQAHWQPPGIANPIGALYVHAVTAEDGVINGMIRGGMPLFAGEWAGRTGASDSSPFLSFDGARNLKVELAAVREYARAVYANTDTYLLGLTAADLEQMVDLSQVGMGQRPLSWCLNALVASHVNNMTGEISALKGVQGAKGYPF